MDFFKHTIYMERIIECVPNFSEGRNKEVINAIVAAIEKGGKEAVCDRRDICRKS